MHFLLLFLALIATPLYAEDLASIPDPAPKSPWEISGSLRIREEFVDWFKPKDSAADPDYHFGHIKGQLGLKYSIPGITTFVQGQVFQLYDLPLEGAGPGTVYRAVNADGASPFGFTLRQAYLDYATTETLSVRAGRSFYANGSELPVKRKEIEALKKERIYNRVLGTFEYTAGRSFDGARATTSSSSMGGVQVGFMNPTEGGFSARGSETIDKIDIAIAAWQPPTSWVGEESDLQFFYYYYGDDRSTTKLDNRDLATREGDTKAIELHNFGLHAVTLVDSPDTLFHFLTWGVFQGGRWGEKDVIAGSFTAETGVQLKCTPLQPTFRVGINYGSGDHNPEDDSHNTFFAMLPTGRQYAMSLFYNQMNTRDLFAQVDLKPSEKLTVQAVIHHLSVNSTTDLLYSGAGASEEDGSFGYAGVSVPGETIGVVPEIQLDYLLSPAVTLTGYVGHLLPSDSFKDSRTGSSVTYGFVEMMYKF